MKGGDDVAAAVRVQEAAGQEGDGEREVQQPHADQPPHPGVREGEQPTPSAKGRDTTNRETSQSSKVYSQRHACKLSIPKCGHRQVVPQGPFRQNTQDLD